ncbi:MAG: pyrimidine 5'-nucleotidase [Bauldia sp.]|nr:MAG: pyrimidine 5'-nucleotidase [Bauldia sp.]MBZ0228674.1 pyrimidine 5'-nucleotidase [Bauldia sp.]
MNAVGPRSPAGIEPDRELARFAAVDAWIFDLDNTLYPRHTNLFLQVDRRIRDYVERLLGVPPEEAHRIQKDYYRRYGTTLRGLMVEHGIRPDDFLEYVHDIDHTPVEADPPLAAAIGKLPGRKYILTNGSRAHAEKIAARLGVTGHFDDIFDIVRSELLPKPARETYDRFMAATGVNPETAAMFEDLARNLVVPQALGMATVLVVPNGTREVFHEDWELEGHDAEHIDFLTDDLGGFLERILTAIA